MNFKLSYIAELNLNKKTLITIILPLRAMKSRNDIEDRLTFCLKDTSLNREDIDFLVIDDGSNKKDSQKYKNICKKNSLNYLYINSNDYAFSIARARNVGAMYSISPYIMFMDIDLYPYNGFYNDVLSEIKIQELDKFNNDFLMFGVIYLTKDKGEKLFFDTDSVYRKNTLIQKLLENDETYIDKFSTGTSVNVYNRYAYLSHGGNDEDFEKWGYDDLEFNSRMIRCSKKFPLPEKYHLDYRNFKEIVEYVGWKSIYRLYGDMTFQKGIILFHIWHDTDHDSDYIQGKEKNRVLFEKKIKQFSVNHREPEPLPSMNKGKTLLFSKTNPFIYNRKILPLLGTFHIEDETLFNEKNILEYITNNAIDRVLMFNPYGDEDRLNLYRHLKEKNIPVLVSERGALRDSVFYDWNGFNAESSSYDATNWDNKLSYNEITMVKKYIQEERRLSNSLEKQNDTIGAENLRQRLNISQEKKVLFVPLQRPSDSVIKYFCGPIGTYQNFIDLVQDTASLLNDEWQVIVKKHPLEDKAYHINNVIYSNDNIKDLLDLSDAVLLINSGVGLLSMLLEKPVYYCGDVFYNDDRINKQIHNTKELVDWLYTDFKPDMETIYRFLYFLLENFYSFGTFKTKEIPWEKSGRMTVTTEIDFYKIRNIDTNKLNFYTGDKARISKNSILFDRYKNSLLSTNGNLSTNNMFLFDKYQNSIWIGKIKKLKKIPLIGTALVHIKQKILKWDI